jgi:RiboL-PSP-HEPN
MSHTFQQLQIEVLDRLSLTDAYLRSTRKCKGIDRRTKAFAKGMVFVQLYATYEFTVRGVTTGAIDAIAASGRRYLQLNPCLLSLMLHDPLKGVRECGSNNIWKTRERLFEKLYSADQIVLLNTTFPSDGSHFRQDQLETLFRIFGIHRIPARRRRHLQRINEVVNHRNEIAHGRATADQIGRSYTHSEIRRAISQIRSVCLFLISQVDSHFESPSNYCSMAAVTIK